MLGNNGNSSSTLLDIAKHLNKINFCISVTQTHHNRKDIWGGVFSNIYRIFEVIFKYRTVLLCCMIP